jgi:uncharacterized FAD-dependent dehydrogenase
MKNFVCSSFLLGGIRVSVDAAEQDILKKAKDKMKREGFSTSSLHFQLFKKSVDARRREEIRFECTVLVRSKDPSIGFTETQLKRVNGRAMEDSSVLPVLGKSPLSARPLVVGMGPAGLFAALLLAQNGYAPILIDRGGSIKERELSVKRFRSEGILDTESNIQFGAGGAGTFSDGKLITRIHDPKCSFVLKTFVDFGAPEEILVQAKPHVGTDLLRVVVSNLLCEIQRLGGEVIYNCRMEDFSELADQSLQVLTNQGELHCGAMILAPGHSSRDTYEKLIAKGFAIEQKPISVGVRAEHLQRTIDEALYGRFAGHPNLGHAEYSLSDTRGERGVYSFCMCPGGEVVAAASEEGGLVVNGMSYHARSNPNANAAVVVSVLPSDIEPLNGNPLLGSIAFQRSIERAAYGAGGGNYVAPIMTMGDFLSGKRGSEPSRVLPSYRDGKVCVSSFDSIFPPFVLEGLRRGFTSFGKRISGYDAPEAILTAAETRTSAPLRILRDAESLQAVGHSGIYPCGEGAGYAGGITSAGVDGIRCALALMERFAPILSV